MTVDEISTPALVLNLGALERNIARMAKDCADARIGLRPHTKTHKSPWIAARQLSAGAVGICTAKLGEAEAMVQAGITNVLVTTEITPPKIDRFLALAGMAEMTAVVDNDEVLAQLGQCAAKRGLEIPVLVDVNVGQDRTGVESGQPAAKLAEVCAKTRGVRFMGLQGYEGHLQHIYSAPDRRRRAHEAYDCLLATKVALESAGIETSWITTAGTGTYRYAIEHGTPTEVQPGSYVVMDSNYAQVAALAFENALFVVSGVVSVNRPGQLIVDAGWKTLSTEDGMPVVHNFSEATYEPAGDEHGRIKGIGKPLRPGDHVWLVPSHCDTTINLHNCYILIRDDGRVEGELPIMGRGRVA